MAGRPEDPSVGVRDALLCEACRCDALGGCADRVNDTYTSAGGTFTYTARDGKVVHESCPMTIREWGLPETECSYCFESVCAKHLDG